MSKTLEGIIERLEAAGYPIEGEDAAALWYILSSQSCTAVVEALELYKRMGYEPFAGYPLVRAWRRT